jgi:hypothetical protein
VKRCILILFISSFLANVHADISAVDSSKLAEYSNIRDDISFLQFNAQAFDHWSADWQYPLPREKALSRLIGIAGKIRDLKGRGEANVDLDILLLVVYQYLYNLEDKSAHEDFYDLMNRDKAKYGTDYRFIWLNGEFLANEGKAKEAIEEYQMLVKTTDDISKLNPSVAYGYGMACLLASMPRTALIAFRTYAERIGKSVDEIPTYKIAEKNLSASDVDAKYPASTVWDYSKTENDQVITSRMLGYKLAIPSTWQLGLSDYSGKAASVQIKPGMIHSQKGKDIGITLLLQIAVNSEELDEVAKTWISRFGNGYNFAIVERPMIGGINYLVYRVTNESLYTDRGGMQGYLLIGKSYESPNSGFNLEIPHQINLPDTKTYFRALDKQDRISGDRSIFLMVDSCREIGAETDELVRDMISRMIQTN